MIYLLGDQGWDPCVTAGFPLQRKISFHHMLYDIPKSSLFLNFTRFKDSLMQIDCGNPVCVAPLQL